METPLSSSAIAPGSIARFGKTSVVFRYEIVHRETGAVHCSADITKAVVDMSTWKPIVPPPAIRKALASIAIRE